MIQERHETYMRRRFIEDEIHDLQKQIQPHDTGHIHTSISYLESRAEEVQKEIDEGLRKAAYAY